MTTHDDPPPEHTPGQRTIKYYGWKPDLPDARDYTYKITRPKNVPAKVSLRSKAPAIYDQGELGSCTANAGAAMMQMIFGVDMPSRLQIYWHERFLENTVNIDNGAEMRSVVKVLSQFGAAMERDYPYDIRRFRDTPPQSIVEQASRNKIIQYMRLISPTQYMRCLADGFPFIFGFSVYDGFEGELIANTGVLLKPNLKTERVLGGHAVTAIGYDRNFLDSATFKRTGLKKGNLPAMWYEVRNSWSDDWGDKGNFWMPSTYLENRNLADDMWTIRKV